MRRMMLEPIPPKVKQLWDTCDLRGFIILSLLLQTILIFVAPMRKRSKSKWVLISLWVAYLSADWAANFAVGLILNSQGDPSDSSDNKKGRTPVEDESLLALWATFLLVHLGGPDTITAYALEDNELWVRHVLGLVLQCVAVVYVFIMSLPRNGLWIPTVLIFLTGMIKYIERSRSLYLASVDKFKYPMLKEAAAAKNYAKLFDIYSNIRKANLPAVIQVIPGTMETIAMTRSIIKAPKGRLSNLEVVWYGHQFFEKYVGLYVDKIFNQKEWGETRAFFHNRTAKDAFRVAEVELNFLYDVLFTKLQVVYTKFGGICRIFSLASVCLAFVLFALKSKTKFRDADVMITYALLIGALVLDISALLMLFFSDWTIIHFQKLVDGALHITLKIKIIRALLIFRTEGANVISKSVMESPRWSETIPSYNLMDYCLHPREKRWNYIVDMLGITDYLDSVFYVKRKPITLDLKEFIFKELKFKAELADSLPEAKELSSERGAWVLRMCGRNSLVRYVSEVDYDQSLMQWHMATEICFNYELTKEKTETETNRRRFSKLLSDYMMYLLVIQPSLMPGVDGVGQIRFLDARAEICEQVKRIPGIENNMVPQGVITDRGKLKKINACQFILNASASPNNDTVLFESCRLAKELLEMRDRWDVISKVWVEMLCYAAINTRANMQIAQVSKGGELITIVWLLMTHFGLGDRFQHKTRKTRQRIFVGK